MISYSETIFIRYIIYFQIIVVLYHINFFYFNRVRPGPNGQHLQMTFSNALSLMKVENNSEICLYIQFDFVSDQIRKRMLTCHLTHRGLVTSYTSVIKAIIRSDNDLLTVLRQSIFWISAGCLLTGPTGTNFSRIWTKYENFHSWKCICRQFCLGLDALTTQLFVTSSLI